jgi:hypothetical protein
MAATITPKERTTVQREICRLIMIRVKEANEEEATFLVNEWEDKLWNDANGQIYLEKYHQKKKHLEKEVELLSVSASREEEIAVIKSVRIAEAPEQVPESIKCTVCFENKVDCKLGGCPHLFCTTCVSQFPRMQCPLCRRAFTKTEKVLF